MIHRQTAMQTVHEHPQQKTPALRAGYKLLLIAVIAVALLGVFMLYTDPQFMVTMADQLWSCF